MARWWRAQQNRGHFNPSTTVISVYQYKATGSLSKVRKLPRKRSLLDLIVSPVCDGVRLTVRGLLFVWTILCRSVVKAPTELNLNLSGQIPVIAAKGEAVVENQPPVGHVEHGQGQRETFAEIHPSSEIKRWHRSPPLPGNDCRIF